jgi:hypothetical protein
VEEIQRGIKSGCARSKIKPVSLEAMAKRYV